MRRTCFFLRKFGVPDDLIRIIANLHDDFSFTVNTGGSTAELPYTCGVCQGDSLAAILFLFFLQASLERIEQQWEGQVPIFATKLDGRLTAYAWNRAPDLMFLVYRILYAEDGAFLFSSRKDLISNSTIIFKALRDFGLIMHIGRQAGFNYCLRR